MGRSSKADEILELPAAERLRLVEDIWDSLAAEPSSVPVPDWHRAELERRLSRRAVGPDDARSWDDVKADLIRPSRRRRKS